MSPGALPRVRKRALRKLKSRLIGNRSALRAIPAAIHRYRGSVVEVDGVYLKLDRSLSLFMVNVLRRGRFSVEEQELILPALETDDVVMELGGGVGHLSTRISKILGSERVFTFEANPELEPLMRENFRLNGVRPKAEFCLLGHSEGRAAFYVNRDFWVSSREPELGGRRIEVPVYLLNERIRDIDPSFLVVDVEGGERDLFDGLDYHNIRKLMLELHVDLLGKDEVERILGLIRAAGFSLERRSPPCLLFRRNATGPATPGMD